MSSYVPAALQLLIQKLPIIEVTQPLATLQNMYNFMQYVSIFAKIIWMIGDLYRENMYCVYPSMILLLIIRFGYIICTQILFYAKSITCYQMSFILFRFSNEFLKDQIGLFNCLKLPKIHLSSKIWHFLPKFGLLF